MDIDSDIVCLDLCNKELKRVPDNILRCGNLRMLCLENNDLGSLPDELFIMLSHLTWLDVRNNKIQILSGNISNSQLLETLLVQNNCIQQLPVELGLLPKLRTLNLCGNPIIYPSPDVLNMGVNNIVAFLKAEYDALMYIEPEVTSLFPVQEFVPYITMVKPRQKRRKCVNRRK